MDIHLLERLKDIVRSAGTTVRSAQDAAMGIREKSSHVDLVTLYDPMVQEFLRSRLLTLLPEAGFLGEEDATHDIAGRRQLFIVDPIDGTTNLIHGYQMSAVSLAFYDGQAVVFGAVYNPFTEELFTAQRGRGAYCNGVPIQCTQTREIASCLVAIGTAPYYKEEAARNFERFQTVFLACQDIRRSGSAALDLCYVACGRIDAYFERHLKPWDYAAGQLLIQEAGGCVTGWQGEMLAATEINDVLATNGKIHERFLEVL